MHTTYQGRIEIGLGEKLPRTEMHNEYWHDVAECIGKARAIRRRVDDIKVTTACMDCKRFYPAPAMEFDHRPGEGKSFEISRGYVTKDWLLVKAEIAKCDLVCACCHNIRTWRRRHMGRVQRVRRFSYEAYHLLYSEIAG